MNNFSPIFNVFLVDDSNFFCVYSLSRKSVVPFFIDSTKGVANINLVSKLILHPFFETIDIRKQYHKHNFS